jgi:DNA-directed RNA polymerase subunit RPC12/RpoP
MKYKCVKCKTVFTYKGCYAKLKCPKCYSRNVLSVQGYSKLEKNGGLAILTQND